MRAFLDFVARLFGAGGFRPVTGHESGPPERLEVDAAGWLISSANVKVVRLPSVRSQRLTTPLGEPLAIIWHYTATKPGTARSLAKRIQKYDPKKDRAASWHVVVERDGTVYQSVPFERGAWHCAKGVVDHHKMNACSVGIEVVGHGQPDDYPPVVVRALGEVVGAIRRAYPLVHRARAGLQHSTFDPARRSDAGLYFVERVLPLIIDEAFGAQPP